MLHMIRPANRSNHSWYFPDTAYGRTACAETLRQHRVANPTAAFFVYRLVPHWRPDAP